MKINNYVGKMEGRELLSLGYVDTIQNNFSRQKTNQIALFFLLELKKNKSSVLKSYFFLYRKKNTLLCLFLLRLKSLFVMRTGS